MKIKRRILIALFLSVVLNLHSQVDFIGKLYVKSMFENYELKDTSGGIWSENEIFDLFYRVDTTTNCFGEIEGKFIENIYSSNGLIIVRIENELDTVRDSNLESKIQFIEIIRDDNGIYTDEEILFSVDRKIIENLINPIKLDTLQNDKRLLTEGHEYWCIDEILIGGKNIFIDTCHKLYNLSFNNKSHYTQNYNGITECEVILNIDNVNEAGFFKYWENQIRHQIIFEAGKWKTSDNKLLLANLGEDEFKLFSYEFKNDKLVLRPRIDYEIILKKKASQ